jgi:LEA14-like dessication related protein
MQNPFGRGGMIRHRLAEMWWIGGLAACTPLGLWMYEDPGVTLARVRLDTGARGAAPVIVALDLRNPNDYALSATSVRLKLRLDELPIGQLTQASSVEVPKAGMSTVAVPLVPGRGTTPARLKALSSGVHRFAIEGEATFATPIGDRKVRFAEEGELAFGQPPLPASAPAGRGGSP